ncbi:hypothetical protein B005_1925 [Nocardiopsis alba ATCC BAA-2165]|uniref:Uncharacterized protein n=1 Tax=Nocardiopsis alba (strain ATCC BAA-2165 / BE74) TaxID=1205910 RepID=J7LC64_NOCAA|nr:hypothetical protein B005_1925 [Nocardiopsis alba ATCC BAA-2165]
MFSESPRDGEREPRVHRSEPGRELSTLLFLRRNGSGTARGM